MKHAFGILLVFLCFSTPVWAQTSWKGQAEVWADPSLPLDGYFAATDQFPRNTILIVESYQTHKTVQVRVTSSLPLGSPSLVVLSPKAASALGMEKGESVPVSVQIDNSLEGYLASGGDKTWNPDPDVSPSLAKVTTAPVPSPSPTPTVTPTPSVIPKPSALPTTANLPATTAPVPIPLPPPVPVTPALPAAASSTPSPSPSPTPSVTENPTTLPTSASLPAASAPLPLPVPTPLAVPATPPVAESNPTPKLTPSAPVIEAPPASAPVVPATPTVTTPATTPTVPIPSAETAPALALAPPLPQAHALSVPGALRGSILGNIHHVTSLNGQSYVQLAAFVKEQDLLNALNTIKSYVPLTVLTKRLGHEKYYILVATAPRSQLGILLLLFQQQGYNSAFAVQD